MKEAKDLYAGFKSAVVEGKADDARTFFNGLTGKVRGITEEIRRLSEEFWRYQSAGDAEGAQAAMSKMGFADFSFFTGDPLEVGDVKDFRIKENGVLMVHRFKHAERYLFDFELCRSEDGWEQFDTDQDAYYFGVWVNKTKKMIVSYTEGDIYIGYCLTDDVFNAEISDMINFYGEGFVAKVLDESGSMTYSQDRQKFFIS